MEQAIETIRSNLRDLGDEIDVKGQEHISSLLQNSNDPWQDISQIQSRFSFNSLLYTDAIQCMLDMTCSHASVHCSVLESLKMQLESVVEKLDQSMLPTMLDQTIQFITVRDLRSVPISIIKKMLVIPEKYLHVLLLDQNILSVSQFHMLYGFK